MINFLIRHFIKNYQDIKNPNVRKNYGLLSGIVGIVCNLILCLLKFIAGFLISSIATIADAFNNLSDAISSVVTFFGFKMSNKPADKQHPFGHGRFEYIAGLIISMTIIFMGIELVKSSIERIFDPEKIFFNKFTVFILLFSIGLKIWMGFFNKKLSKAINSSTLKALSIDSLIDVVATSIILIGSLITKITGFSLDSYCGIAVALFVIYTGIKTAKETLDPLLGQNADEKHIDEIKKYILSYKGIYGVHGVIIHNYGPTHSLISLHVEVLSTQNVVDIHKLVDQIEQDLKKDFNFEVVIHVDPIITESEILNTIKEDITKKLKDLDKNLMVNNFRIIEDAKITNIGIDLYLPENSKQNTENAIEIIKTCVHSVDSDDNINVIIKVNNF